MAMSWSILALALLAVQATAWSDNRTWTKVPKYKLNLDLPQKDRWTHIVADFKHQAPEIQAYLSAQIPKWAMPIITLIAKDIRPYFTDYAEEMLGLADGYGLPVGEVVAVNLIYQLESLGLNCSTWNNTGPTTKNDPGCMDVDRKQDWCYCHDKQLREFIDPATGILQPPKYRTDEPSTGLCTSVVANTPGHNVMHGRNLDWNVPEVLRKLIIDVEYQRQGKTVFTGTTMVGFVGVLNGMQSGQDGWSVSLNARGKGGKLLGNIVQALLHKSMTPTQHMRKALEDPSSFSKAVQKLSATDLIDQAYFVAAGAVAMDGGVISRGRDKLVDFWGMNSTDPDGWFRLETNYDHWNPVPKADDRRSPGIARMKALGPANITQESIFGIMKTWPVYNMHTDYTCVMNPREGIYSSGVWL